LGTGNNANSGTGSKGRGPKKAISFSNACLIASTCQARSASSDSIADDAALGPLVDDGAPYSAIGLVELRLLLDRFGQKATDLEPIPSSFAGSTYWQYGSGDHSSAPRRILRSIVLAATSDSGREVLIRHLVLDGSSQWVIGKNVTQKANILHLSKNALQFSHSGDVEHISLLNSNFLSYIPLTVFVPECQLSSALSGINGNLMADEPWCEVKAVVDKVPKHVCGHANFTDMRMLLERNGLWNDTVEDYVDKLISDCTACRSTAPPQPSHKVSISTMSKEFNDTVCVDHFYLESVRLMHCMDIVTRFSAAFVVTSSSMDDAVFAYESCWLSQFWQPSAILGDKAFAHGSFKSYLESCEIRFKCVPPRRHSKNPLERKHGIIRSIFLKLQTASTDTQPELLALRAVEISKDLYGNDVMSSSEMAKGYTKPVLPGHVAEVPDEVA